MKKFIALLMVLTLLSGILLTLNEGLWFMVLTIVLLGTLLVIILLVEHQDELEKKIISLTNKVEDLKSKE